MQTLHLLVSGDADEIKQAVDLLQGQAASTTALNNVSDPIDETTTAAGTKGSETKQEAPAGDVVLDKRGFPFDERIHSPTRKFKGDGNWLNKRGVDKDLLANVEAKLQAAVDAGQTAVTPTPTPTPETPAPAPVRTLESTGEYSIEDLRENGWEDQQMVDAGHAKWVESTPAAPAAPEAPAAPPANTGGQEVTPDDVMQYITNRVAGTIQPAMTEAQASELCAKFGMSAPFDIYKDGHCMKAADVMAAAKAII
jgi:hypothetical protein